MADPADLNACFHQLGQGCPPGRAGGRFGTESRRERSLGDVPGGGEPGRVGCLSDGVVLLLAVAQVDLPAT